MPCPLKHSGILACRGGTSTAYSWGDAISSANANFDFGNDANQTVDVGQYFPNRWGFYDMHGNVWEWTNDWFLSAYHLDSVDPQGPLSGAQKLLRRVHGMMIKHTKDPPKDFSVHQLEII